MKPYTVLTLVVCLAALLGFGTRPATAQMVDIVKVTLPHGATVGTITLPAGEYTIRDLTDGGSSSSVLQILPEKGKGVTAVVMRISEPNNKRADHTQVVLQHSGDTYQMDKIWLEGRDYGYELLSATGRE
jgi:hypothetical protein